MNLRVSYAFKKCSLFSVNVLFFTPAVLFLFLDFSVCDPCLYLLNVHTVAAYVVVRNFFFSFLFQTSAVIWYNWMPGRGWKVFFGIWRVLMFLWQVDSLNHRFDIETGFLAPFYSPGDLSQGIINKRISYHDLVSFVIIASDIDMIIL